MALPMYKCVLFVQPPVPFGKWTGIRDATKEGQVCVQEKRNKFQGSEDCLYLNVHTPEVRNKLRYFSQK